MAQPLAFLAQFIASAVGANGLTVTWDVEQITRADGTRSALVTGAATNITVGRRGLYGYLLANSDLKLYDYVATAITAGTADQKEIAAMWSAWVPQQDLADAGKVAPTAGAPAAGSQDAHLDDIDDLVDTEVAAIKGVTDKLDTAMELDGAVYRFTLNALERAPSAGGAGSTAKTITVTDGTNPLDGVEVEVSTDAAKSNVVASGVTDAFGQVTFLLDAGTYYAWCQLAGQNAPNPTTFVVT